MTLARGGESIPNRALKVIIIVKANASAANLKLDQSFKHYRITLKNAERHLRLQRKCMPIQNINGCQLVLKEAAVSKMELTLSLSDHAFSRL